MGLKIKIWFSPWTRHYKPEDILGFDEDGKEILREGAKQFTHSGWNACAKFKHKGQQYGRWITLGDWQEGWIPPKIDSYAYKASPKILYQAALGDLKQLGA